MAESKEELKSLLIMVKEEIEKASLKPYSKNEDHGIRFITDCQKWGKMETVTDFILFSFTITVDADCSHEIKRHLLLLGRKGMTNLDSIFKSRDITWPTKVHLIKTMVFPVVMYGCESWTIKKAECRRIDALEKTLESPLDCKEIQPVHP